MSPEPYVTWLHMDLHVTYVAMVNIHGNYWQQVVQGQVALYVPRAIETGSP